MEIEVITKDKPPKKIGFIGRHNDKKISAQEEKRALKMAAMREKKQSFSYANTHRLVEGSSQKSNQYGICHYFLYTVSMVLVVTSFPMSLFFCLKIVAEYERAVIFRLGRMIGAKGPGLFFVLPCMDEIQRVDLRTVSFDIPPQEILTKDSVTVAVDAVVYYRVWDPVSAVTNVANAAHSTRLLAQTTLRNQLGQLTLSGLLSERDSISQTMQGLLDTATDPWGIKVERVEVKDVRLPQQLQRAVAAEAEATREAQAKIIAAKGEMDASRCLKEAADVISESPGALQLRYLQTLTAISAEKNSTIVFPLPIDMLKGMSQPVDTRPIRSTGTTRRPSEAVHGGWS